MDNTDLHKYIVQKGISAKILPMKGRVHSVEAASKEIGVSSEYIIKTVVFTTPSNNLILAIIKGKDRVSSKRISKAINVEHPKLATPDEARKLTSYEVGGTPPIGIPNAQVFIDPKVMEMDVVIGGGGNDYHLLRIVPENIVKSTNGIITRIRK